ncbi:hypothetical protein SKAU_G00053260 [Synaphobranchus kaupii]|uniref:Uncharacterized protein n=1 Tax=Synaphobranchus kaupii TaxID=118154 RepID=A0A9Q1J8V0_SYNKA|nr:hypothetical protein SKAU_G00053260 [Synaphobranchus kaupii]
MKNSLKGSWLRGRSSSVEGRWQRSQARPLPVAPVVDSALGPCTLWCPIECPQPKARKRPAVCNGTDARLRFLLALFRRRNSLEQSLLEPLFTPNPSYAVRRRFSGSLHLPPLSRRHSTQDARRMLDLEAFSKLARSRLAAKSLDKITDEAREGRGMGQEIRIRSPSGGRMGAQLALFRSLYPSLWICSATVHIVCRPRKRAR